MRTNGLCIALAAMTGWLAGCSAGAVTRLPWDVEAWSYRSLADDPIAVDVAVPVAIDVRSFSGDVIIEADPSLTEATVTVLREATHGRRRKKEADASLPEIDYSIELVPGLLGQVLQVRTWTTHAEPHFQRAHVHIDVPAVDGVTVQTRNGSVYAVNIEGIVNIETTEGDVRVMSDLPLHRDVTITNHGGDIDYRVRGESTAMLDCQAVGGTVHHRAREGRLIIHTGTDHDTLLATLNGGTNPIVLRTVDGDIRIAVVSDPTEVGWLIFDP